MPHRMSTQRTPNPANRGIRKREGVRDHSGRMVVEAFREMDRAVVEVRGSRGVGSLVRNEVEL